jgi:3-phosphoshikimate 1-carboxyvinyltransferase
VTLVHPGPVAGRVAAPPSKSVTHRAFLLAAHAPEGCTVAGPLRSADTEATLACLAALGSSFRQEGEAVRFAPAPFVPPPGALACANSGTTLRLMACLAARLPHPVRLDGDGSLRRRPMADLAASLRQLGAQVEGGAAPVRVHGPLRPGRALVPPDASSQVASGLLLCLPFLEGDSELRLGPPVPSRPYVDLTVRVAAAAGLRLPEEEGAFRVAGGQQVRARRLAVEGDWSAAALLLVAGAVAGGPVRVTGLDAGSAQGDRAILRHLAAFGARVRHGDGWAEASSGSLESPGDVDVAATPDLFPPLAVLAASSRGRTRFTGGAALRRKESDRIEAMRSGLARMGVAARALPDGLEVTGGPLRGAALDGHGDHRVHMALCVAALAADGPSTVSGEEWAAVSHPGFHRDLAALGARLEAA